MTTTTLHSETDNIMCYLVLKEFGYSETAAVGYPDTAAVLLYLHQHM